MAVDRSAPTEHGRLPQGTPGAPSTQRDPHAPPGPSPAPDQVIAGKYRLVSLLGRGGMGSVYRATHTILQEDVALKLIDPRFAQDPDFRRRFFREAKTALALTHPNTIPVRDFGETEDGRYYMTMDFSPGMPLSQLISTEGAVAPARAARIASQILSALAAAHAKGIIHRDIKPQNVLVETDAQGEPVARVLDFGLAKMVSDTGSPQITQAGVVVGTPHYMAPEQARGEATDHRCDIYAVGVLLYEMLCGRRPFQAKTTPQVLALQVQAQAAAFRDVRPDLHTPDALEAAVFRALEKDPDRRFQTANEFIAAIEKSVASEDQGFRLAETRPGTDAHDLIGRTIENRYRVLALVGRGGYGTVYRAVQTHLDRPVALKVLHPDVADRDALERFQREAKLLAALQHANIVQLYDFGQLEPGRYYMAMEFVEGTSLRDRIRKAPLPVDEARELFAQLFDALSAAHEKGIVHRDLKPDNVVIAAAPDGTKHIKVLDFGIAKLKSHEEKREAAGTTRAGFFIGTPEYASPEQCRGETVDRRADLYSAGIVVFETLTGRLPFHSQTSAGYLALHMVEKPARICKVRKDLPGALQAVLDKALAKDPARRYQTAAEMARAVDQALGAGGYAVVDEEPTLGRRFVGVFFVLLVLAAGLYPVWSLYGPSIARYVNAHLGRDLLPVPGPETPAEGPRTFVVVDGIEVVPGEPKEPGVTPPEGVEHPGEPVEVTPPGVEEPIEVVSVPPGTETPPPAVTPPGTTTPGTGEPPPSVVTPPETPGTQGSETPPVTPGTPRTEPPPEGPTAPVTPTGEPPRTPGTEPPPSTVEPPGPGPETPPGTVEPPPETPGGAPPSTPGTTPETPGEPGPSVEPPPTGTETLPEPPIGPRLHGTGVIPGADPALAEIVRNLDRGVGPDPLDDLSGPPLPEPLQGLIDRARAARERAVRLGAGLVAGGTASSDMGLVDEQLRDAVQAVNRHDREARIRRPLDRANQILDALLRSSLEADAQDAVRREAGTADEAIRALPAPPPLLTAMVTLAQRNAAAGDYAVAIALLREVQRRAREGGTPGPGTTPGTAPAPFDQALLDAAIAEAARARDDALGAEANTWAREQWLRAEALQRYADGLASSVRTAPPERLASLYRDATQAFQEARDAYRRAADEALRRHPR